MVAGYANISKGEKNSGNFQNSNLNISKIQINILYYISSNKSLCLYILDYMIYKPSKTFLKVKGKTNQMR